MRRDGGGGGAGRKIEGLSGLMRLEPGSYSISLKYHLGSCSPARHVHFRSRFLVTWFPELESLAYERQMI